MSKTLILGGTKEAAELARKLVDRGETVITSLAGRTKEPAPVAGEVRTGGFGGVDGLATYIRDNNICKVIDVTHPFALQISQNAVSACAAADVPLEIRTRKPWQKLEGDNWLEVEDLSAAAVAIPSGARVLLALGSQYLKTFSNREDVHFTVRMIDEPDTPLNLRQYKLILAKPSAEWREEAALLRREKITHIVCRNSGGEGAYAKIRAARELKLPIILVKRAVE